MPRVEIWSGRREVEHNPADRDDHLDAELEQALAESGDLGSGTRGAGGAQPEFLHQDIRSGGQQDAELIGPKPTTAGPPDLQAVVELLDPILDIAAGTVDLRVDEPRRLPEIGDHKRYDSIGSAPAEIVRIGLRR